MKTNQMAKGNLDVLNNLDSYQVLTLFFGAAIIIVALLRYNCTEYNAHAKAFVKTVENGLPFLFSAYALICSQTRGTESKMYKNLILLIGGGAIAVATITKQPRITYDDLETCPGAGGVSGWDRVNLAVTLPLAYGAMFALPLAFLGFE